MPLDTAEKRELYGKFLIPITNGIRALEALSVKHASHREIETRAQCLHTTLEELREHLGLPFNEADVDHSIYGENGEKGGGP